MISNMHVLKTPLRNIYCNYIVKSEGPFVVIWYHSMFDIMSNSKSIYAVWIKYCAFKHTFHRYWFSVHKKFWWYRCMMICIGQLELRYKFPNTRLLWKWTLKYVGFERGRGLHRVVHAQVMDPYWMWWQTPMVREIVFSYIWIRGCHLTSLCGVLVHDVMMCIHSFIDEWKGLNWILGKVFQPKCLIFYNSKEQNFWFDYQI